MRQRKKCFFFYNVGSSNSTKNNKKRLNCQLSDSDRFGGFANFTEDKDFKFWGLQVITGYTLSNNINTLDFLYF